MQPRVWRDLQPTEPSLAQIARSGGLVFRCQEAAMGVAAMMVDGEWVVAVIELWWAQPGARALLDHADAWRAACGLSKLVVPVRGLPDVQALRAWGWRQHTVVATVAIERSEHADRQDSRDSAGVSSEQEAAQESNDVNRQPVNAEEDLPQGDRAEEAVGGEHPNRASRRRTARVVQRDGMDGGEGGGKEPTIRPGLGRIGVGARGPRPGAANEGGEGDS